MSDILSESSTWAKETKGTGIHVYIDDIPPSYGDFCPTSSILPWGKKQSMNFRSWSDSLPWCSYRCQEWIGGKYQRAERWGHPPLSISWSSGHPCLEHQSIHSLPSSSVSLRPHVCARCRSSWASAHSSRPSLGTNLANPKKFPGRKKHS